MPFFRLLFQSIQSSQIIQQIAADLKCLLFLYTLAMQFRETIDAQKSLQVKKVCKEFKLSFINVV